MGKELIKLANYASEILASVPSRWSLIRCRFLRNTQVHILDAIAGKVSLPVGVLLELSGGFKWDLCNRYHVPSAFRPISK